MEEQEMTIGQALARVLERLAEMEELEKKKAERIEAFEDMPEDPAPEGWVDDWFAVQDVPLDENEHDFEPW